MFVNELPRLITCCILCPLPARESALIPLEEHDNREKWGETRTQQIVANSVIYYLAAGAEEQRE